MAWILFVLLNLSNFSDGTAQSYDCLHGLAADKIFRPHRGWAEGQEGANNHNNNNNNKHVTTNAHTNNNDDDNHLPPRNNQSRNFIPPNSKSDNGNLSVEHRNRFSVAVETRKTAEESGPATDWRERNADDFHFQSTIDGRRVNSGLLRNTFADHVLHHSPPLLSLNLPLPTPLPSLSSSLPYFSSSSSSSSLPSSSLSSSSLPLVTSQRRFHKRDIIPSHSVTFVSSGSFVATRWKIYSNFELKFKIRTFAREGLLLFTSAGVVEKDFIAIEITDGQLRHSFDTGSGPRTLTVNSRRGRRWSVGGCSTGGGQCPSQEDGAVYVNDSKWHNVSISRDASHIQTFSVDGFTSRDYTQDGRSVHFDLNDDVFIGGAPNHVIKSLPRQVKATSGFHGCVADVFFNRRVRNVFSGVHVNRSDGVKAGCSAPSKECSMVACNNGGVCRQEWMSFSCDCQLTGYLGHNCSSEGVVVHFGVTGGLLTFSYPESAWPDTDIDRLALRFRTKNANGIIIRIISGTSNDFIQLAMVDRYVVATYNMGLTNHTLMVNGSRFDDDSAHRVVFIRIEANASLWVDEHPPVHVNTTGFQLTTFNHQMKVFVGGDGKSDGMEVVQSFIGAMSGLSWNGLNIFQLIETDSTSISVDGHVVLGQSLLGSNPTPANHDGGSHHIMTHSKTGSHSTESLSLKRDEERSSSSEKDVTCHELPQKSDESLQRCINASNAFNAFSASPPPLPSLRPHSIFPNFIQPSFPASQPSLQITVHSISSNPPSIPLQASTPQASDEGSKDGGGFIDLDNLKEEWPEELLGSEGSFGEEIFDKNSYASSNNYAQDKVRERRIFLIKQITLASAVLFGTGIFVGLVGLALYKIKIRNQGTYKVNNRQEYFYEPCSTSNHCLSSSSRIQVDQSSSDQLNQPSFPPRKKDKQKNKKAKSLEVVRKEDREWYV